MKVFEESYWKSNLGKRYKLTSTNKPMTNNKTKIAAVKKNCLDKNLLATSSNIFHNKKVHNLYLSNKNVCDVPV